MIFIDIDAYKDALAEDFIREPGIAELIDSRSPDYDPSDPKTLIQQNIFPYLRIPDTQDEADTFLLYDVDITGIDAYNPTYAKYRITVWVMAHQYRMKIAGKTATRIDYLSGLVRKCLDGMVSYGFSRLKMTANRGVVLDRQYHYRELLFVCNDLRKPGRT